MRKSLKTGLGFGITSGVITPLGLLVGLYASVGSKAAIIAGILTIAIADSFADALGIHVSQEFEKTNTNKDVWAATLYTLFVKFGMALSFIIPFFVFSLGCAVITSVVYGMIVLAICSYFVAKERGVKPFHVMMEHVGIGAIVIAVTYFFPIILNRFL